MIDFIPPYENFCPHCGRPYQQSWGGGWQPMTGLQSNVSTPWPLPQAVGGYMEAWRKSPARTPGFISDVAVPAGQAGLIGLAIGTGAILLPIFHGGPQGFPWYTPLVAFTLSFGASVIMLVISHRNHLWTEEHITQGEKESAAPPQESPAISLNVVHTNAKGQPQTTYRFELPYNFSEAKFYDFARGVTLESRGLAQSDWVAGINKLCSKPKYQELLTTLEKSGIVTWADPDNHSVGRRLTTSGRRALLSFVYSYESRQAGRQAGSGSAVSALSALEEGRE